MMRLLVVDTNVFISSLINPVGTPGKVIDAWGDDVFTLCVSAETIAEYEEVIARPKMLRVLKQRRGMAEYLLHRMKNDSMFVAIQPTPEPLLPADPKDDKFLSTAVAAGADAIVSGDEHLLAMGQYRGIPIVSPSAILEEIDRWPG